MIASVIKAEKNRKGKGKEPEENPKGSTERDLPGILPMEIILPPLSAAVADDTGYLLPAAEWSPSAPLICCCRLPVRCCAAGPAAAANTEWLLPTVEL